MRIPGLQVQRAITTHHPERDPLVPSGASIEAYTTVLKTSARRSAPTVLAQEFPLPEQDAPGRLYPQDELLAPYFDEQRQERLFEAMALICFVTDTIEVEHRIVIPAIAGVRRLPCFVPEDLHRDLFSCVADEGFHAEQSLRYRADLAKQFSVNQQAIETTPRFMQRLDSMLRKESYADRAMVEAIHGIVTETRISVELGTFARNSALCASVRSICKNHAEDEIYHSQVFHALAHTIWEQATNDQRKRVASWMVESILRRNMPDRKRISLNFSLATGRTLGESTQIVNRAYSIEILRKHAEQAAGPTLSLARRLGVGDFVDLTSALQRNIV